MKLMVQVFLLWPLLDPIPASPRQFSLLDPSDLTLLEQSGIPDHVIQLPTRNEKEGEAGVKVTVSASVHHLLV